MSSIPGSQTKNYLYSSRYEGFINNPYALTLPWTPDPLALRLQWAFTGNYEKDAPVRVYKRYRSTQLSEDLQQVFQRIDHIAQQWGIPHSVSRRPDYILDAPGLHQDVGCSSMAWNRELQVFTLGNALFSRDTISGNTKIVFEAPSLNTHLFSPRLSKESEKIFFLLRQGDLPLALTIHDRSSGKNTPLPLIHDRWYERRARAGDNQGRVYPLHEYEVLVSSNRTIHQIDTRTSSLQTYENITQDMVYSVVPSPHNGFHFLTTEEKSGKICLWDLRQWKIEQPQPCSVYNLFQQSVRTAVYHPTCPHIIAAASTKNIDGNNRSYQLHIFNSINTKNLCTIAMAHPVVDVHWSPETYHELLTIETPLIAESSLFKIWKQSPTWILNSRQEFHTDAARVMESCLSSDSSSLTTIQSEETIHIWNQIWPNKKSEPQSWATHHKPPTLFQNRNSIR